MKKLVLLPLFCLWLAACTPAMKFGPSAVAPAATGKVQTKRDKNNNYLLRVDVSNLAPADRLNPPQRTYVVWVDAGQGEIRKLGLLEPRSKALTARLNATAVGSPTRVFITAESSPDVTYPAGQEVLTTSR